MDKKHKHSSKKSDTLRNSRSKWPSRSKSFSEAIRIPSGRDRSPLKIKRRRVCTVRRLTGGITLRKRKRRGAYYRILSGARLRRARKGLAKRLASKLQIVRLLAQCAQPQGRSASVVAQAKQRWSVLGAIKTRRLRALPLARRRRVFADDETYSATTDARRLALRAKVHLHRSALFLGQRRVFLAQRRNKVTRIHRALKRRLRRVRPKTKFRYFGVFGKRRRRVERRDKLQLMRLVVTARRRVAMRRRSRALRTKVRTDALRAQRSLIYTAAQAPRVAGVTTSSQRLRLLREAALKRLEFATRRSQRRRLLANANVSRKKGLNTLPVTSKSGVATNLAVGGFGAQKKRKEAPRAFLKGQLSPLSRALRSRFGTTAGISLPFRRSLHRTKILFIGRSPAVSKRVVEPPQGSRKYWRKVTRRKGLARCRRLFAKWRRAILRGYSSRVASKRRNLVAQLSRRAESHRRWENTRKYYEISLRPSSAATERGLAGLRRRSGSTRRGVNGLKVPLYTTPYGVLGALRTSHRRLKAASRAAVRATHVADTLNAFVLRRTVAGISLVGGHRLAAERAQCTSTVELRSRKLFEKRLYRRQLKLRLPCTSVSRKNLRHGGHVLFARNTLKTPTTLEGKRNQMLAPTTSWAFDRCSVSASTSLLPAQFRRIEKRGDALPRAWKRPPSFLNSLRASRQRERRKALSKRRAYYAARRLARRAARRALAPRLSRLPSLRARLEAVHSAVAGLRENTPSILSVPALARLTAYRNYLEQQVRADAACTQIRPVHASGVVARTIFKKSSAASTVAGRIAAEKHVQSVRRMLKAERGLSAWSPLYPLKWRRWSSPRAEGLPLPRTWASHKTLRQRALLNESLTYRGLPERRYVDLSYSHLQYYRGSAAGIGYARFRRAYRPRSLHNRWWKPVNYAVPFENPYSRRALNATKYITKQFTAEALPRTGASGTEARSLRGEFYPVRYPPTNIPWRNYKFRKPKRRAAPYNIQRWTRKLATYATIEKGSYHQVLTLRRSKHAVRRLERLFPQTAVWAGRRWEALDPSTASTAESCLLETALTRIPLTVWSTLRYNARSAERYAMLRQDVFSRFRQWSRVSLIPSFVGGCASAVQLARAVKYLHERITTVTAALSNESLAAFGGQFSSNQLLGLEQRSYSRLVQSKKDRFWTKRQLPSIQKECTSDTLTVLARENVPLYKRWLHGAERYLRHSQSGHLPTAHDHNVVKRAVNLGRRRPRFPASGRRRASYDSMLHAFTRRTSPARFRRVANVRFQALAPIIVNNFKVNQAVYEQSRALRRRRMLSSQLSRAAYLSPVWRELLAQRSSTPLVVPAENSLAKVNAAYPSCYGQPRGLAAKRRFASLPINAVFKQTVASVWAVRSVAADPTRAVRIALLRCALRRRRTERTIFDLKKHALARRLPKEQVLPPWRSRRSIQRRRRYASAGDWGATALKRRPASSVFWTLHHLGSVGPRLEDRAKAALPANYYGETLRLHLDAPKVARKVWSRVGFCITPRLPQKLRRRKADSHLRQRRRRRLGASDMSMTRFNHWSERPQLLKLHRASSGRVGPLLTRFARRLIRTMHNRRNGRIASTFARKGLLHGDLPHQRLATRALHQKKLVALQERARELATLGTAITSKELYAATPLYRSGKARQLIRSANKHRSKLQVLQAAAHRRSGKKQKQYTTAAEAMSATEGYVGRRFVESLPATAAVAPLFFQNHTKTIVKTEATIERERLANIASKELRYKITAQYAEGLTSFIPSLISQMISRRTKTQKLTRRNVKRIVSSTYWSLRVYLNVDPFDARFYLRDGNYEFRSSLEQEMLVRAKGQNTEQPQRAALRRRFQPGRLHLAHNSDRFRFDWLRTFFPLKHSLFQEDPDDYGNLPIATARLRRLMPSGYGIYNWETAGVTPSLETRSRQVLTLRYSRATPRVETMLQGARRLPIAERPLSGAAAVGAFGAVGPFFSRPFSSYAHRATALLGRLIYQRKRFTGVDEDSAPTFIAVAGRYRVKSRVEARGRTNFSFSSKGTMVGGALDPRFLRYKSPRSRQYLLRLPESFTTATAEETRTKFATYRERRRTLAAANAANWTRTVRRTFAFNPVPSASHGKVETTLQGTRDGYTARRSPTHLEAQMLQTQAAIKAAVFNDFHTRRKSLYSVWAARAVRKQLRETRYYRGVGKFTREQAATNVRRTLGHHLAVESGRPILQYRTPAQRSLRLEYKAERVIAETSFELTPRAARYARRWRDLFGRSYIFLQTRRDVRTRAAFRKQLGLKARTVAPAEIRPSSGLVLARMTLGHYRKLPRQFASLRRKFFAKLPFKDASAGELSVLNPAPLKRVSTRTNFSLRVGGRISARASVSKEALEIEVIRRRTPFEVYRPKLWHKLTNRWMKRERTMRFWLKDTKRWLRDPWLSEIVACRPKVKGKRPAGELALVEQQIGEYVPEVDSRGIDIPEDEAVFREREEFVASTVDKATAIKPVRRGPRSLLAVQRRAVSVEARKKPIPTLWLANHEYRGVLKEVEENLTKTPLQRVEEEQAKVKEYWRRKKAGLPQPKERRLPLKHPADHWLPAAIWREIQRRARRLEWRESDELFFRKGFRNAFRFFPGERNRAPWLEALMYNRSLFSTRRGEFRRRQFPREQKKYKWLQRVRKAFFPSRSARYIKGRRWPRLRMYNQKLFYSLFNLPDRRAASRHFRKLNRRKGKTGGFAHSQTGLGDRLDVTLMHLNLVPTIFWARVVAPHGLLRVNGKIVKDPAYRLSPGDFIQLEQERILRFRHFFKPVLNRRDEQNQPMKYSSGAYPANFTYYPGLRSLVYNGLPKESELRRSNRLNARLFRWFKLDSV